MGEKIIDLEDRVPAIRLTDHKGVIKAAGDVYTLDFCRESVSFAEARGFKLEDVLNFPVTGIGNLFYYAFRMHHRSVSREKVDRLREEWGGIPKNVLERLIELYNQAALSNTIQTDEDAGKNGTATVEM